MRFCFEFQKVNEDDDSDDDEHAGDYCTVDALCFTVFVYGESRTNGRVTENNVKVF